MDSNLKVKGEDNSYQYTLTKSDRRFERFVDNNFWDLLKPNPLFKKHLDTIYEQYNSTQIKNLDYRKVSEVAVAQDIGIKTIEINLDNKANLVFGSVSIEVPTIMGKQIEEYCYLKRANGKYLYPIPLETELHKTSNTKIPNELFDKRKYQIGDTFSTIGLNSIHAHSGDSLTQFFDASKQIYLIDFSYLNCYYCIKALPAIQYVEDTFKSLLQVYILDPYDNSALEIKRIKALQTKFGLADNWYLIDRNYPKQWMISEYPTYFLLDRKGIILEIHQGYGLGLQNLLIEAIIKHSKK